MQTMWDFFRVIWEVSQGNVTWFMLTWFFLLQVWAFQRRHTRGYSHLPREWPPALAGQTEPSPSSWEVWSPSTSYSRAGKTRSSKKEKKRREISCCSLPYEKQFWFCHCSLILPARKKKGGNLGSREVMSLMFNMKNCLPLYLHIQPCTHLSHIPNDDAKDGAWANLTPARGRHDTQETVSRSQGHRSIRSSLTMRIQHN